MESGILIMDKPQGFTSFDVIGKLRGILKMKKLGHTGTLDPMATGVLPVLVGTAARACDILPDEGKAYRAGFRLGTVTDTQDSTGTVLQVHPVTAGSAEILRVLPEFTGWIDQIPPMYSAVQINGKRLYELARAGKEIERPARRVLVEQITLEEFDGAAGSGVLSVRCGKGTYVRTLIHDIGQRLSCGAHMTALTRTEACGFSLSEAHSFDEVQQAADSGCLSGLILPTDRLFADLPALRLNAAQSRMYANGVKLTLSRLHLPEGAARLRVYADSGRFFGLAEPDRENGVLRIYKNL
ncbi:MAG: tRNA pseudouridine(55) synthase TruB [Oscillospiraceae bacterium]|nr:tRNA pseudouridine(55) synthase TruB [Oscillospiraceae bacterium]MCR5306639.1 tRNA pseudouridine(55) synthase TruB [Oscillospiraceae bacterium]